MSTVSTTALVDGGKAIALSVVFGMVVAFVPVLAILALPLVPIPVAYVTCRHRLLIGVLAAIGIGALSLLLAGPVNGLLVFLLAALVGIGSGMAIKHGAGRQKLLLILTGLFLAALVSWGAVGLVNAGMSPADAVSSVTDQVIKIGQQTPALFGGQQGLNQLRDTLSMIPYLLPALLLVAALALSAGMVFLTRRVFDRLGQAFPDGLPFRELRLHFSLAYAMIVGLICYLFSPYISADYSSAVYLTGLNLLIVSQALFFVQALAITHFFLGGFQVSRVKRVIVYTFLVLLQTTLSLPSWLGLLDIWIDYRRRFTRRTKPGPGQV